MLENNRGEIVGVEVKAAATLRASDWKWLKKLADARGESFKAGIVVYAGEQTIPLGTPALGRPVQRPLGVSMHASHLSAACGSRASSTSPRVLPTRRTAATSWMSTGIASPALPVAGSRRNDGSGTRFPDVIANSTL